VEMEDNGKGGGPDKSRGGKAALIIAASFREPVDAPVLMIMSVHKRDEVTIVTS